MFRTAICTSIFALLLAGCGGGGSSGKTTASPSPSDPSPTQPTQTPTVTVTLSSTTINQTLEAGASFTTTLSGTWSGANLNGAAVYLQVSDSAGTFSLPDIQAANSNGNISYTLSLAQGLFSGEHSGTLTVRACKDATCSQPYSGTAGTVDYHVQINPSTTGC
ncbi:MAG: hypothetical protein QM761_11235 [Pseudoxanthomonas sp.]